MIVSIHDYENSYIEKIEKYNSIAELSDTIVRKYIKNKESKQYIEDGSTIINIPDIDSKRIHIDCKTDIHVEDRIRTTQQLIVAFLSIQNKKYVYAYKRYRHKVSQNRYRAFI